MSFPEAEVTRSLSNNFFKAGWVVVQEDTRVIDSNEMLEQRLQEEMALHAAHHHSQDYDPESVDGFSEGLEADQVDALFMQPGEGDVLKASSQEELDQINVQLEEARQELVQIQEQAKQMLEDAEVQIESMRQQTLKEAQDQGYQEGYDRGMAEVNSLKQECQRMEKQLEQEYQQKIEELEPAFIEALTGIYEHIFKVDLSSYNQLVVNLLIDAMQKTESVKNYIIHVSKEDYPWVSGEKKRILEETGAAGAHLEIISDMTLSAAQCMIETESGIFDCSLGTELEELKRRLLLLSYKK